jgi:hypothetical protein
VLGSILAQAYRIQLGPHLSALPAPARNAATSSITASHAVAAKLGPAGRDLAALADASFVHAMHLTTLISAAITLLGALVVMRWMPGRAVAGATRQAPPGRQVMAGDGSASEAVPVNGAVPANGAAVLVTEAAPGGEVAAEGPGGPVAME